MNDWRAVLDSENAFLGEEGANERVGLALSGGGIRSATFSLGVLQYITRRGWLKEIDYLSTVSGGGYTGSWLTALIHRRTNPPGATAEQVNCALEHEILDANCASLRWIRRFGNYLTPHTGLSWDTLSTIGLILSNLVLSLAISVLLVGALGLGMLGLGLLSGIVTTVDASNNQALLFWGAFVANFVGSWALRPKISQLMDPAHKSRDGGAGGKSTGDDRRNWLGYLCAGVAFVCLSLLASIAARGKLGWAEILHSPQWLHLKEWPQWLAAALAFSIYQGFSTFPLSLLSWHESRQYDARLSSAAELTWIGGPTRFLEAVGCRVLVGAVGGLTFALVLGWIGETQPGAWTALMMGAPAAFLVSLVTYSTHMMVFNRRLTPELREWWYRVFAFLLAAALAWLIGLGALVLGPALFTKGTASWASATIAALIGSTAFGMVAALGKTIGARNEGRLRHVLTSLSTAVFVSVLVLLVFTAATRLAINGMDSLACDSLAKCLSASTSVLDSAVSSAEKTGLVVLLHTLIAIAALVFVGIFYNANWHSMYELYRSRLARCFLGASNPTREQNRSSFDRNDDIVLSAVRQRPYPLLCCTLNLVGSQDLAWQTRKATSFVFSPLYVGYVLPKAKATPDRLVDVEKFAPSRCYMCGPQNEVKCAAGTPLEPWQIHGTLGSAMTISGAAAAPSCGYHTRPFLAFLMAVFNIRLGRWCPNPAQQEVWCKEDPPSGVLWFVYELLGKTNEKSPFVYLSDGGHFDNLGLYELVRRRCRYIIAIDGEHDPKWKFDGLSEAVRKCRLDLDAEIEIDPSVIRPLPGKRHSPQSYAIGNVRYPDQPPGRLLYLKLSQPQPGTVRTAADIEGYAAAHPDFPHESTADQWFDETQFESYRKLGEVLARETANVVSSGGTLKWTLDALCRSARTDDVGEREEPGRSRHMWPWNVDATLK